LILPCVLKTKKTVCPCFGCLLTLAGLNILEKGEKKDINTWERTKVPFIHSVLSLKNKSLSHRWIHYTYTNARHWGGRVAACMCLGLGLVSLSASSPLMLLPILCLVGGIGRVGWGIRHVGPKPCSLFFLSPPTRCVAGLALGWPYPVQPARTCLQRPWLRNPPTLTTTLLSPRLS
jgi:hypothetical protein